MLWEDQGDRRDDQKERSDLIGSPHPLQKASPLKRKSQTILYFSLSNRPTPSFLSLSIKKAMKPVKVTSLLIVLLIFALSGCGVLVRI